MILKLLKSLPPLAWLVEVAKVPRVLCGEDVRVGSSFLVEGGGDGPSAAASFHTTENSLGSGYKALPDWILVSASATDAIDCLFAIARTSRRIVSNSSSLLLAYTELRRHRAQNYIERLATVTRGTTAYDRVNKNSGGRLLAS